MLTASTPPECTVGTFASLSSPGKKRRLRDTRLGQWLTDQAPTVLDAVGDVLPERGVLGIVKNLVEREPDLTHDQRMEFERLMADERSSAEQELTRRWEADMASTSWLAKHTRPLIVLSLVVALFVFMTLDSLDISFEVRDTWVTLYEILIVTAVGGYFTLRSVFDKRPPHP